MGGVFQEELREINWWVVSAKTEETRLKHLDVSIACSAEGRKIPLLTRSKKPDS